MSKVEYISDSFWRDKNDLHVYNVGDDFPHIGSFVKEFKPERIEYLLSRSRIKVKEEESPEAVEETQAPDVDGFRAELMEKKNDELKEILTELGIKFDSRDNKETLVGLIIEAETAK